MKYAIINLNTNEWVEEFEDKNEAMDTFLNDYRAPFSVGLPRAFPCVLIEVLDSTDGE